MAEAKVNIKAQDNTSKALNSAKKGLSSFEQTCQKVGKTLSTAFTAVAVVASLKKLGDACVGAFKDFEEANKKYRQLKVSLGDTSDYDKAVNAINKLSRQSMSSKGDIESMVAELGALGKNGDEIDKISSAAVYLSNVTGQDLNSAMNSLLNTTKGSAGTLAKYGIGVEELTKEQLENGEAIDLVIEKMGKMSEELSKNNASQSLKNIKDSLGDIIQGFGEVISDAITPMLGTIDTGLSSFKTKFNDVIKDVVIVISNFPTIVDRAVTLVKGMFKNFFDYENVKAIVNALMKYIVLEFKNLSNMLSLFLNAIPSTVERLLDGIFNYAMYIVTNICDEAGFDLTKFINDIGQWLVDSPIGKVVDSIITSVVNGIRLISALIKNVPKMIELVAGNIGTIVHNIMLDIKNGFLNLISNIVSNISQVIKNINIGQRIENLKVSFTNVFGNIGGMLSAFADTAKDTFRYIGDILKATFSWDTLKNTALSMIEKFCNYFIDAINSLIPDWFSKIPGLKEIKGLSRVSLVDEGYTNPYANVKGIQKGENTFVEQEARVITSAFGEKLDEFAERVLGGITEQSDWSDISKQFSELLTPVFEEYSQNSVSSIGATLATWTQKSSKEYLEQSGKAFSSIGDFLKDWGTDFLDDNSDAFKEIFSVLSEAGDKVFGEDISAFTTWLDGFMKEQKTSMEERISSSKEKQSTLPVSGGEEPKTWFGNLKDSLGGWIEKNKEGTDTLGSLVEKIHPLIEAFSKGSIWMAVIIEIAKGAVEVLGPAIDAVLKPIMMVLKIIGQSLGQAFLPLLDALAPLIKVVAKALIILAAPIQWVADLLGWLGAWITYFGSCIGVALYNILHPFDQQSYGSSPGSFSSNAFSSLGDKLSMVDSLDNGTGGASTMTAVQNASYSGGGSVTVNVYFEGSLIGDDGMGKLATIIKSELIAQSYYGV